MSNLVRIALLAAVLTAGVAGEATALTFKNIAGKWCGVTSNYIFTQNSLTVIFHDNTPTRKFKVVGYDYLDDSIKMHWLSKGEKLYTDFGEFGADGRTMAQVKNEAGPRRPFQRCK